MIEPEIKKELTKKVSAQLFGMMIVEVVKIAAGRSNPDDVRKETKKKAEEIVSMILATVEAGNALNAMTGKKSDD